MAQAVGAEKGKRAEGRLTYQSGYYTRSSLTRVGKLELRVPQDRQGRFSTETFEGYQRSGSHHMYIQGYRLELDAYNTEAAQWIVRIELPSAASSGGIGKCHRYPIRKRPD
jgi:hypothetical protein